MTITRRLLLISLILCPIYLSSCTDDEQQAQIDRQKRVEQQEAQDKADREQKAAEQAVQAPSQPESTPQPEQTPETPAEPEKVENFMIGSIQCMCRERNECGMTFWGCEDHKVHACMHDVNYTVIEVNKTDDNNGNCGS